MVLGGAGGIAVAIALMWYVMGIDLLGIFSADDNRQQVAQSDPEPEPLAPEKPQPAVEPPSLGSGENKQVVPDFAPIVSTPPAEPPEAEPDPVETPPAVTPPTEETPVEPVDPPEDPPQQSLTTEPPEGQAAPPAGTPAKPSPPDQEAENQALTEIGKLYKQNYAEAKTSQQKIALANLMLRSGREKKDNLATKYALLRVARDVFKAEGELTGALATVEALDETFQIDAHAQQAAAFMAASESTLDNESRQALLTKMQPLMLELIEHDRFELATPLVQEALSVARKTRDNQVIKVVSEGKKHVDELAKEYDTIRPMLETLATEPDNGDANLAVGIYYAAHKDDWEKAADHFARSSDMLLKSLVKKEQADPPAALALGDGWWDLAALRSSKESESFRQRALEWYPKAWKAAAPVDRRRIEERVTSVESIPIDRSEWDAYCWHGHWKKYELDKFDTAGNENELLIKNTSGIHDFAVLRHSQVLRAHFYLSAEVKTTGKGWISIAEVSTRATAAYFYFPASPEWQSVVIQRNDTGLTATLNEETQELIDSGDSSNRVYMFSIMVPSDEFAGVRKLVILE
jgi:hypothetical protein